MVTIYRGTTTEKVLSYMNRNAEYGVFAGPSVDISRAVTVTVEAVKAAIARLVRDGYLAREFKGNSTSSPSRFRVCKSNFVPILKPSVRSTGAPRTEPVDQSKWVDPIKKPEDNAVAAVKPGTHKSVGFSMIGGRL